MRMRSLSRAALLGLLAAACSESPTRPADLDRQFDFSNGPADLTNVGRTPFGYQFVGFYDGETDLWIYAVAFSPPCLSAYQDVLQVSVQDAGLLREAVNTLQLGDLFLYVYSGSGEVDLCHATPLAAGVGHFMYTDNDAAGSGTRTNSWTWRMNGQLELTAGGKASLTAVFHSTARAGQSIEHAHVIRLGKAR